MVVREPTAQQLHPGAGLVNGRGVAEEEECHAGNAAKNQHHGEKHKHRGCLECSGRDWAEVGEATHAGELPAWWRPGAHAVVEEAEVADLRCVDTVANPVGLNEHHNVDNGKADGEDGPKHSDGPGVAHVIVMIYLGGFLGRQHVWSSLFILYIFLLLFCFFFFYSLLTLITAIYILKKYIKKQKKYWKLAVLYNRPPPFFSP